MPLVWAHSEYLRLVRSLADDAVFDLPPQPVQRYLKEKVESRVIVWRFDHQVRSLPRGKILRIETLAPAKVHWSGDDWETTADVEARDTVLGVYVADLTTNELAFGSSVKFTFYWPAARRWEGRDFLVRLSPDEYIKPLPN
jgi:glucoamylase